MKHIVTISFLFIFTVVQAQIADFDAKILAEFLVHLQKPLTLHILNLCWSQVELTKFMKSLHRQNIRTRRFTDQQLHDWKKALKATEDVAFFVDFNCAEAANSLKIANETGAYLAPLTWIILKTDPDPRKTLEGLNLFLPVSSRVYVIENARKTKNTQEYNITSLYTLSNTANTGYRGYIVNLVAYVHTSMSNAEQAKFLYFTRLADATHRRNLRKINVRCTTVMTDPRTIHHQLDGRDRHIDSVFKATYPQALHMFDYVNATPVIEHKPTWGYAKPDGTFTEGMMKDYQDETIEIAATAAFVLKDRMSFVSCFQQYQTLGQFTFRAPPLSSVHNIFLLSYSRAVWLAFVALMLIFIVVFYIITYCEARFTAMRNGNVNMSLMENKMADLVLMDVSLVCQQGLEAEPSSISGRIATFIVLLSTLFLFTAYSANILTLLQSTSDDINSVQRLYDSKIKIGFEDIPYSRFLLKAAEEPIMQKIYHERVAFLSSREGVRRMRNEFYAFHAESWTIYNLMQQEYFESQKCGICEINYFKMHACSGCRRTSPYKEIFASGYRKFDEYGIGKREYRRINVVKPKCSGSLSIFTSISMVDVYATYSIFSAGLVVCCIVFVCEQIHWRRMHGNWFLKVQNTTLFLFVKRIINRFNR